MKQLLKIALGLVLCLGGFTACDDDEKCCCQRIQPKQDRNSRQCRRRKGDSHH